jgi:hypothetical protein
MIDRFLAWLLSNPEGEQQALTNAIGANPVTMPGLIVVGRR